MSSPFFSIVIPTRNRYETLRYSLQTVLEQEFDSFEIVLSDNSDESYLPNRTDIDSQLKDSRIKYYRPETVLPMSDHWEFALSKVTGEFVIVFGDDDGLVAGALKTIHSIIVETKEEVVSWGRIEYNWPNMIPVSEANAMVIPFAGRTGLTDSVSYIRQVIHHKADYRYLPMLYNSAVSVKMIDRLKQKTGNVFNAISPDIYTGYAFAYLAGKYITIGQPLSINGISGKSNGAAHMNTKGDKTVRADFSKLLKASRIKWPTTLPDLFTPYLCTIEPFIQLSAFFPELKKYISREDIYKITLSRLEGGSEEDLQSKVEIILTTATEDAAFSKWVSGYVSVNKPRYNDQNGNSSLADVVGFGSSHLTIDAQKFGVDNVYDASVFAKNLLGELKDRDFMKPSNPGFMKRMRRAAAIVVNGF